jgi:hypothetical protein
MPSNLAIFLADSEIQHSIWVATGGSMLVLLQSILSGERRVWWKLLVSCIIGGSAAALVGNAFEGSTWVYIYCGISAIVAENIIFGLVKASEQFKQSPITVFAQLWRVVMPSFGKVTDKPADALDVNPDDGKPTDRGDNTPAAG